LLSGTFPTDPTQREEAVTDLVGVIAGMYEENIPAPLPYNLQGVLTLNLPSGLFRRNVTWNPGWLYDVAYIPSNISAVFSLYTSDPSRKGRGIFRYGPVLMTYIDGNSIPSLGGADAQIEDFFLNGFTYFGFTFIPCVWSRKANQFLPIIRVAMNPYACRLSKRRAQKQKQNPWIPLPNVG